MLSLLRWLASAASSMVALARQTFGPKPIRAIARFVSRGQWTNVHRELFKTFNMLDTQLGSAARRAGLRTDQLVDALTTQMPPRSRKIRPVVIRRYVSLLISFEYRGR